VLCDAADDNVFAFLRFAADGAPLLAVSNFSPVVRQDYRLWVPTEVPAWQEELNTDDVRYGGGGVAVGPPGALKPEDGSLRLTLPPLATVFLTPLC
jgi:1,4-alpha-glucan branching enzyme